MSPDGRVGRSLWSANAASAREVEAEAETLVGSVEAATIMVGAGVAGLSTALHLARDGHRVVVLEATSGADAATAASAGIVTGQTVRKSPNAVLARLGPGNGALVLAAIAESADYMFRLIEAEGIACDAVQAGFLAPFAGDAAGAAALLEQWRPFRTDMDLLDAASTASLSGCRGYAGATLDRSGGTLDPVAHAGGLAARVAHHGGTIYRNSPVRSLSRAGSGWRLQTPAGEAVGARVVLCANGGNPALHPGLRDTVLPLPVCQVATEPLGADLRASILPQRHALTDLSTDVFSIRTDRRHRLITATPAPARLDYEQIDRAINARLAGMIPSWRTPPLDYVWSGTAWLNSDLLPRFVGLGDGLIAIQACNGRGLAINTLAGREAARWAGSVTAQTLMLPLTRPRRVFGFGLARHLPRLLMGGTRIFGSVRSGSDRF